MIKNDETNIWKAKKPHAPVKLERIFSWSKVKTIKKEKLLDFIENSDNKPNEIKRVKTYDINDKYKGECYFFIIAKCFIIWTITFNKLLYLCVFDNWPKKRHLINFLFIICEIIKLLIFL